jgi:hypothetical protein
MAAGADPAPRGPQPRPRRISLRRQHGTEGAHTAHDARLRNGPTEGADPGPRGPRPAPGGFHCAGSTGPRRHTRRATRACGMGPPKARTPPHVGPARPPADFIAPAAWDRGGTHGARRALAEWAHRRRGPRLRPTWGGTPFAFAGATPSKRPRKSRRHRTTHRPNLGYTRPAGGVRRLVQYRM